MLVVLPLILIKQKYLADKLYCCFPIVCLGFSDRTLSYGEVLGAFSNFAVITLKKRQLAALL